MGKKNNLANISITWNSFTIEKANWPHNGKTPPDKPELMISNLPAAAVLVVAEFLNKSFNKLSSVSFFSSVSSMLFSTFSDDSSPNFREIILWMNKTGSLLPPSPISLFFRVKLSFSC